MSCSIKGCKSNTARKNNEPVSFHRFPQDKECKNKWLLYAKKKNWMWRQQSLVCSKHFTLDSFEPNERTKWRRLKEIALPTLYLPDLDRLESSSDTMDVCHVEKRIEVSSPILNKSHCDNDIKEEIVLCDGMDTNVCYEERIDVSRRILDELHSEIDIKKETVCHVESMAHSHISELGVQQNLDPLTGTISCTTLVQPVRKHEPNTSKRRAKESSQQPHIIAKPLRVIKEPSDTSSCTTCNEHEKTIKRLQKELERVKKVSETRLRKINTLSKRLSRQCNRTDELYSILINRVGEEDIETEYLTVWDDDDDVNKD